MSDYIEKCPMCASQAEIHRQNLYNGGYQYQVRCINQKCRVMIPYKRLRRVAIEIWNRRLV